MAAQPRNIVLHIGCGLFYGSQWFFRAFREGEICAYKTLQKAFRANGPSTSGNSNGIRAHKENAALDIFSQTFIARTL